MEKYLVPALIGGVLGGGSITALIVLALREKLRQHFATVETVNGLGGRVHGLETVAVGARESADNANDRISRMEVIQQQQWERIAEHVVKPLDKIAERMDSLANTQSQLAQTMAVQEERMRHIQEMRG